MILFLEIEEVPIHLPQIMEIEMVTKIQLEDAIAQMLQSSRPTITFSENSITISKDGNSQVLRGIQRNNSGNIIRLR